MSAPDKGIPKDLLGKAQCVVIVPGLKKAAFVFGGEYGRGFAVCRNHGVWGGPAAVRFSGGSFGAEIGGESTDIVMLVMNRHGMEKLASDNSRSKAVCLRRTEGRGSRLNSLVLADEVAVCWVVAQNGLWPLFRPPAPSSDTVWAKSPTGDSQSTPNMPALSDSGEESVQTRSPQLLSRREKSSDNRTSRQ